MHTAIRYFSIMLMLLGGWFVVHAWGVLSSEDGLARMHAADDFNWGIQFAALGALIFVCDKARESIEEQGTMASTYAGFHIGGKTRATKPKRARRQKVEQNPTIGARRDNSNRRE